MRIADRRLQIKNNQSEFDNPQRQAWDSQSAMQE